MEEIRQNGKIILHSDDGISIKMIFKNLTGKNFQGQVLNIIPIKNVCVYYKI